MEVMFPTIAAWTLRYQHGSPKHLIHMGYLTAFLAPEEDQLYHQAEHLCFCSPFHRLIWSRNSSTAGTTDTPFTEFRDEKPPLHPWSVPMGWEERHLHQKDSPRTKNLHHADTETSSVIGSHLAQG